MMGQAIPPGFYVSNSADEDVFCVAKDHSIYFKKSRGRKWSYTDKWNFDHVIDVTTINEVQGASASIDTHDGRGIEVKVSAHVGVTAKSIMKWHYVGPDSNQATLWVGPEGGVGGGVSADVGVWYDADGDIHMKFSTSGVIPHIDFGGALVVNPKSVEDLSDPTSDDKAFAKGFTEGATFGVASKPPKILSQGVAVISKVGSAVGKKVLSWFK